MSTCFSFIASSFLILRAYASLPGDTNYGVLTVDTTVDIDQGNQCVWSESEPITDSSVFPFSLFAAVDTDFFRDAVACGECYKITCLEEITTWSQCACSGGDVTVMVVDYGQDITGYDGQVIFDIESSTASSIMTGSCSADGARFNVTYTQVCCEHDTNVMVYNTNLMTDQWLSWIVTNVRGYGSIEEFYMREPDRTDYWQCNRDSNGANKNWVCDPWGEDYDDYLAAGIADGIIPNKTYFEAHGNSPSYDLPIDIKIVNTNGEILISEDLITEFTIDVGFDFGSNYDENCNGSSGSMSSTSTTEYITTDLTSTDVTTTDMTSTDVTTTEETSTTDMTSTDMTSTDMTSTEETSTTDISTTDWFSSMFSSTTTGGTRGYIYVECDTIEDQSCESAYDSGDLDGNDPCCVAGGGDGMCMESDPPAGGDCRYYEPTTTAELNSIGNRSFNVELYELVLFSVFVILATQYVQ